MIVVPIHRRDLSAVEVAALQICAARSGSHAIVLVHKASIHCQSFVACLPLSESQLERFMFVPVPDHWLESIASYNSLLLQGWFYRLFSAWTYLLIFQLDAWLLSDQLDVWLAKRYSYIGAPWTGDLGPDTPDVGVGNGGFSLRCVKEMIAICESSQWHWMPVFRGRLLAYRMTLFRRYHLFPLTKRPLLFFKRLILFAAMSCGWHNTLAYYASIGTQEDHLLSVFAPQVYPWLRLPSMAEAAGFAVETNPRATFAAYGIERPLGCHAWEKHDRAFWCAMFPEEFGAL